MANRPFQVLFVSADRAMLRHASRLLTVFGYQVQTATSPSQAASLLPADPPDVLLLDGTSNGDQVAELCRQASIASRDRYVYKLLAVRDTKPAEIVQWLEAGVDDFLGLPLEHGELLARLRTAARVLEFERRLARFGGQTKSGLLNKPQLVARAAAELAQSPAKRQSIACLAFEIDHWQMVQPLLGRQASEAALARITELLSKPQKDLLASAAFEPGRFAVLVRGGADDAIAFAGRIRKQLAPPEPAASDKPFQLTFSGGAADATMGASTADELLRQAEANLVLARSSGGDVVGRYGEFAAEEQQWAELAKNGALFEKTLARDIMVPCTLVARKEDTLAEASALFEQTQLQAMPVVDEEGKLAGLLTASTVRSRLSTETAAEKPVSSAMTSDVASFDERTTLAALIDYFTQESPLAIAIVHKGRPTGLVTPSSLATLSEQLTEDSFAESTAKRGRAGLIVSNLCGVDA
jgi:two-component system, cell cycle response regulator